VISGSRLILGCLLGGLVACGGLESPDDASGWIGTITTEGNVTTVINESGSLWGGDGRLVEEASIGVETGEDAYMFGNIESVAIAGEHIFVLDRSVPVLRVYDLAGNHLLDVGRAGQGPGEFTDPYLLAVSRDGRAFVRTMSGLVVFDSEGNHLMTLNERGGIVLPMVVDNDGTLYLPVSGPGAEPGTMRTGHLPIAPDGTRGEMIESPRRIDWQPWTLIANGRGMRQQGVPYSPSTVSTLGPDGSVVAATSDAYRVEVQHPDGRVLAIERTAEGVPVGDAERAWHEEMMTLLMRQTQPDWTWNANPIPATKPYFSDFYVDAEGVLWVRRVLRTEPVAECDRSLQAAIDEQRAPRPCFRDVEGFDVFGADGRFMGSVELPPVQLRAEPAIDGDRVVLAIEDEAGTIMVKRYRLVRPGGQP